MKEERLIAYVVSKSFNEPDIRKYLNSMLPGFMVPDLILQLSGLKLTANGKVDYEFLKSLDIKRVKEEYVSARNAVEVQLVQIWEEVLGVNKVGIDDNFFKVGGNSMSAVRLHNKIIRQLGVSLPLQAIFEIFTVRGISDQIQKLVTAKGTFESGESKTKKNESLVLAHLNKADQLSNIYFSVPFGGTLPATSIIGVVDMVPHLSKVTSFYGIQAPPLIPALRDLIDEGKQVEFDKLIINNELGVIVDQAVTEILSIQKEGPFRIGGYCTGCVLSWEIARQLINLGYEIEKLILIDPPSWVENITLDEIRFDYKDKDVAAFVVQDLGWDTPAANVKELLAKIKSSDDSIWSTCNIYMEETQMFNKEFESGEIQQAFERKYYNDLALEYFFASHQYKYPKLEVGESLIITTQEFVFDHFDQSRTYIEGDVDIRPIPYNHSNLFLPSNLPNWVGLVRNELSKK